MTTAFAPITECAPIVIAPSTFAPAPDHDAVLDGRMPLAVPAPPAAERHAVVEHDVVADPRRLADHHAHPVIDEEAPADARARVDLDAGEEARELRQEPRRRAQTRPPQPVGHPVRPDRVQPGVRERDLEAAARGRVVPACVADVLARPEDRHSAQSRRSAQSGVEM